MTSSENAAGRLLRDGVLAGYLISSVEPFRGLTHPLRLQERMWMTIECATGSATRRSRTTNRGFSSKGSGWRWLDWLDWVDDLYAGRYRVEWVNGDERMQ